MRAQSKPFVVEVKGSKRVRVSTPKTIWGDLGFAAFANSKGTNAFAKEPVSDFPVGQVRQPRGHFESFAHEAG